jgi:hypothetical protein
MAFFHKALALLVLVAVSLSLLVQPAAAARGPLITHKVGTHRGPVVRQRS